VARDRGSRDAGGAAQPLRSDRARERLIVSGLFVVSLAALAIGYAADAAALRVAGVLGAACFGLGCAPLALSARPALAARLGAGALLGFTAMTLLATAMALTPLWQPVALAVALAVAAAAAHLLGGVRALRELRGAAAGGGRASRPARVDAQLLVAAGTALWLAGALGARHIVPANWGFLTSISWAWYLGLALLLAGLVRARGAREWVPAAAVVSLAAALTLTPALIYGLPGAQSAIKHVELVQVILHRHRLDPANGIYDAYSGLFAAAAWICSLARIRDSLGLATYWPCVIAALRIIELRWLFGSQIASRYRVWAAVALVVLADAIGGDYFSPQSLGYVLGIGVFALVLDRGDGALGGRGQGVLLVLAGCGLAVTHELSPYIVGGVLVLAALARWGRPAWAALAVLLPAAAWAAINHADLSGYISLSDLGDLSNFAPPRTVAAPGLHRAAIIGYQSHALALGVVLLTVLALIGWWRRRRERWAWACLLAPAVGLAFIAVNPYGNEGIFRATLFGIPWLALLAANAVPAVAGRRVHAAFALAIVCLLATFLIASFALDGFDVVRAPDVAALRRFEAQAPAGSYLVTLSDGVLPGAVASSPNPDHYVTWQSLLGAKARRRSSPPAIAIARLVRGYERYARRQSGTKARFALYALWSPAGLRYEQDYGLVTAATMRRWREDLRASPLWRVAYAGGGTYLFRLVAPGAP
jgi:hypothetical protein